VTDNSEDVVRRSLDAVDRHRTRLLVGLAVGVVVLILAFVSGANTVHSGNTINFVHAVFIVLLIWTTLLALVVVLQITAMTKRILRAIDLASRK
jgi:hypothetical protein